MAAPSLNLINQQFGRLVVIQQEESDRFYKTRWLCKCVCGNTVIVTGSLLKSGHTQSCGCLMKERVIDSVTTHGLSKHPAYLTWYAMIDRCYNEKNIAYHRYGGRGIIVCDEWRESLEAFYRDMGDRPSVNHSLDRKDNDKGYSKDNCRWATSEEQAANRERSLYFEHKGEENY